MCSCQPWLGGWRYGAQLVELGVVSAWDLAQLPPSLVRKRGVLEMTVLELQGREVLHRFRGRSRPQTAGRCIASFGKGFEGLDGLLGAVGEFATRGPLVFSAITGGTQTQHWRGGGVGRSLILLAFLFTSHTGIVASH